MRKIAILHETTLVSSDDLGHCLQALLTQVTRDFGPLWGIDAALRVADEPEEDDEILWLCDDAAQADVLRIRTRVKPGQPCGFAFVRPSLEAGESWTAALSHQLLEMLADRLLHLAAEGMHQGVPALFALEVCDPVAGDDYEIAGVPVANFVLPTWFFPGPMSDDTLVDFLGRLTDPFTLSPGGHASFCTEPGRWQAWFARRCPIHRRRPGAYSRRRRRVLKCSPSVVSG